VTLPYLKDGIAKTPYCFFFRNIFSKILLFAGTFAETGHLHEYQ